MSTNTWTDPDSGVTFRQTRERRTSETVELRACPEVGDLYLDDLRQLVARCAHLSGDARVHPRENGIDVEYTEFETEIGEEVAVPDGVVLQLDSTTVFSDEVMAELRERLAREKRREGRTDEPTVDGPEDYATDRERDARNGL